MRVLMISTDRNIFKRGSQVRRRMVDYGNLVEELHIVILTKKGKKEKITNNTWVYPTNSATRWFYIFNAIEVARAVIKEHFLTIHKTVITTQDPFETGLIGWWLKKKFEFPLQIQIHTDLFSPHFARGSVFNRVRVKIAEFLLPRANGIRVVSRRIQRSLRTPSFLLPIFVDIKKIKNATITKDLRKKYPGKKIVLMASRQAPEKNIPLAERAVKEVIKKHPEVFLFRVSNASSTDLMSYYKTADVFLLTSNFEGYGMVLVEAAAVGLPIVSTDVGVAPEIKGAKVVDVGDVDALVNALVGQVESPQQTEVSQKITYKDYLDKMKKGWEVLV